MTHETGFDITDRDYAILRGLALHRPSGQRGYFALLRHKLQAARVVAFRSVGSDLVTMGRSARYRIADGPPLEHMLVIGPAREVLGRTVSLRSIAGLALLGLREGQHFTFEADGMAVIDIHLEAVLHQPAANENDLPLPPQPA